MADVLLFLPEIVCLVMALLLFFAPVCSLRYGTAWGVAVFAGIAATAASLYTWPLSGEPFFPGIYRVDFFSQFINYFYWVFSSKIMICQLWICIISFIKTHSLVKAINR